MKKENFSLKLKVHFLEERLAELTPEQMELALKQNISLKIEAHSRGVEIKKYKKLILELERTMEDLQRKQEEENRNGGRDHRHPRAAEGIEDVAVERAAKPAGAAACVGSGLGRAGDSGVGHARFPLSAHG